jgi:hypothetical protein
MRRSRRGLIAIGRDRAARRSGVRASFCCRIAKERFAAASFPGYSCDSSPPRQAIQSQPFWDQFGASQIRWTSTAVIITSYGYVHQLASRRRHRLAPRESSRLRSPVYRRVGPISIDNACPFRSLSRHACRPLLPVHFRRIGWCLHHPLAKIESRWTPAGLAHNLSFPQT